MKRLACMLALCALSACGFGGSSSSAPERYQLTAKPVQAVPCRGGPSLQLRLPNAAPGIDSARIVVMDRPNHLTLYQGVAWSVPAPRLVQQYLFDSFEPSGMFARVSTDLDVMPAEYELITDLRAFHVDLTGEPSVRIRLTVHLLRASDGKVLQSSTLQRSVPIRGANIDGIVAIFAEQMHSISQELQQTLARAIPTCVAYDLTLIRRPL